MRRDVIIKSIQLGSIHQRSLRGERQARRGASGVGWSFLSRRGRWEAEKTSAIGESVAVVLGTSNILKHSPLVELSEKQNRLRPEATRVSGYQGYKTSTQRTTMSRNRLNCFPAFTPRSHKTKGNNYIPSVTVGSSDQMEKIETYARLVFMT